MGTEVEGMDITMRARRPKVAWRAPASSDASSGRSVEARSRAPLRVRPQYFPRRGGSNVGVVSA